MTREERRALINLFRTPWTAIPTVFVLVWNFIFGLSGLICGFGADDPEKIDPRFLWIPTLIVIGLALVVPALTWGIPRLNAAILKVRGKNG